MPKDHLLGQFSIECRKLKVTRDDNGFALLCFASSLNQSDAKLTTIATWSPAFSHALGTLLVFNLSCNWLFRVLSSLLTGRCSYLGFGVATLNRKAL